MNPTAQTLDPKLKEAYDRVMGTQLNTQPLQKSPQPVIPSPQPTSPAKPATPAPEPVQASQPEMVNINATAATIPQVQTTEKKNKLRPVIFIVAGIAFFALYTLIWLKFFSVI